MLPRVGARFLPYINCINLHSHQQTQEHLSSCLLSALGYYPREVECLHLVSHLCIFSWSNLGISASILSPLLDYFSYFLFTRTLCIHLGKKNENRHILSHLICTTILKGKRHFETIKLAGSCRTGV